MNISAEVKSLKAALERARQHRKDLDEVVAFDVTMVMQQARGPGETELGSIAVKDQAGQAIRSALIQSANKAISDLAAALKALGWDDPPVAAVIQEPDPSQPHVRAAGPDGMPYGTRQQYPPRPGDNDPAWG